MRGIKLHDGKKWKDVAECVGTTRTAASCRMSSKTQTHQPTQTFHKPSQLLFPGRENNNLSSSCLLSVSLGNRWLKLNAIGLKPKRPSAAAPAAPAAPAGRDGRNGVLPFWTTTTGAWSAKLPSVDPCEVSHSNTLIHGLHLWGTWGGAHGSM
jgi:hypothetical protein